MYLLGLHVRMESRSACSVMRAGSDLGELVSQDLCGSPVRSSRSRGLGPVRDRPYSGPVRESVTESSGEIHSGNVDVWMTS